MPKKNPFEMSFAAVVGVGMFPTDMLRYDHCVPASEHDSGEISRTSYNGARIVFLKRYKGQPGKWTSARWGSFGWDIMLGPTSEYTEGFKTLPEARYMTERVAKELTKQRI